MNLLFDRGVLACVLLFALPVTGAVAQSASTLTGFQPSSDYQLLVDGEVDSGAKVYFQRSLPGYLVMPSELSSPVLLLPRTRTVRGVSIMKISRQGDGSMDLAPDALFTTHGQLSLDGTDVTFAVDGHRFRMREKPSLLGLAAADDLVEYEDRYGRLSESYQPSGEAMERILSEKRDVDVRIYFGSWCPFCQRYVPRMVRVANDVAEAGAASVTIDFYGLPKNFSGDEVPRKMNIRAVPTGVVFIDGKEAGRIQSDQWQAPEKALARILEG